MMKKTRLPALLLAGLLFLPGCAAKRTESLLIQDTPRPVLQTPVPTDPPALIPADTPAPAPVREDGPPRSIVFSQYGKDGLVDSEGSVVLPFEYDGIRPSGTQGLFILLRYEKASEDGEISCRIADSRGAILTDWSPAYPLSSRSFLLFWDAEGAGTVLAAGTGETVCSVPFRQDDSRYQVSVAGNLLMQADVRQGGVSLYRLSDLKEGKEEPVFTLSTGPDNGYSLDEIGDRVILHVYGQPSAARLLDRDGRSVGSDHGIIEELYTSDVTYTPSPDYMKYSDDDGQSWGILRSEDGKILTEPIFQSVSFVSGDLVRSSFYGGNRSGFKVYSVSLGRYLCEDTAWEQISLGLHGTAYGSRAGGGWYEISAEGQRFIGRFPGAWNAYELGDTLVINDYSDGRRLFLFDRTTLRPVQNDRGYLFIDPVYMRTDGKRCFIAQKEGWPVYDLLDEDGNVVLKNVRYITQVDPPYAVVTQGFYTGIVNLETGEWIYRTGAFSYLDD